MVRQLPPQPLDWLYPASDGKPMADNTEQYRWIVLIKENLEILFAGTPDVFVAADLLWYPVPVDNPPAPCQAPDVMVVFGRPKGKRQSYLQWQEGDVPPQVVFEILSQSNRTPKGRREMEHKFSFYQQYGVEEYYLYDPDRLVLEGWLRQEEELVPIAEMSDWVSPRLQVRLAWQPGKELQLYSPDGGRFLSSVELRELAEREHQRAEQAESERERERQRAERLATYLRSLGLNPDDL